MPSVTPRPRSIAEVKSKLLNPALTSHFQVVIGKPPREDGSFNRFLSESGAYHDADRLNLMCSETSLPGSQLATSEVFNDFPGVNERHVNRRQFDDRIDLTFYCDADQYLPIRFFEAWMKYITNERSGASTRQNYSYRMKFPNTYKGSLEITKFEKNMYSARRAKPLTYGFVNCFPLSIASMPVTYDASDLLKCSVSFAYSRYYMEPSRSGLSEFLDPLAQSLFNSGGFGFNPGGIPDSAARMAGNVVSNLLSRG
tara:strand:+ start:2843 stop:3607 length:765 start_codon:yes stop_codon:yes gene_type:complete